MKRIKATLVPLIASTSQACRNAFAKIVESETQAANDAMNAREKALDEHGYGASAMLNRAHESAQVVGIDPYVPVGDSTSALRVGPRAPFAGLCYSLMKRRASLDPDFYLGGVRHLMGKFGQMPGNENGGKLFNVIDRGMVSRDVIDGCMTAAREAGDEDAFVLGRLLLTLTDEQLETL